MTALLVFAVSTAAFAQRFLFGDGSGYEPTLNNVMAQYFSGVPTTTFVASKTLAGAAPDQVTKEDIEQLVNTNVTALIDLGAYHFLTGDHGTAVQYFQRAATADPTMPAKIVDATMLAWA